MKKFIKEASKCEIPDTPLVKLLRRKQLPAFLTLATDFLLIDENNFLEEDDIKIKGKELCKEQEDNREETGIVNLQPTKICW